MFTGIISDVGRVAGVSHIQGEDMSLWIETSYDLSTVDIGASIACSGVCLTVVAKEADRFRVDVSGETLARTASGQWAEGAPLNLERALRVGDELGGHIVTGHIDGVGQVVSVERVEGSLRVAVLAPAQLAPYIATKGSIAVDGVSLTVNDVLDSPEGAIFHLNIIPHTAQVTTLGGLNEGDEVNLEIDTLARYLQRLQSTIHTPM